MRRVGRAACGVLLCVGALTFGAVKPAVANPQVPNRAFLLGDSFSYESEWAIAQPPRWSIDVVAAGGAAVCDMVNGLALLLSYDDAHPQRIAIESAGDNVTPCMQDDQGHLLQMGTSAYFSKIQSDLDSFLQLATSSGAQVTIIEAPPVKDATWNASIQQNDAIETQLATQYGVSLATAPRDKVSKSGTFVSYKRCLKTEAAADGCANGRIAVRTITGGQQGVHFCPTGIPDPPGPCPEYSSGELRFGRAEQRALLRPPLPL